MERLLEERELQISIPNGVQMEKALFIYQIKTMTILDKLPYTTMIWKFKKKIKSGIHSAPTWHSNGKTIFIQKSQNTQTRKVQSIMIAILLI